MADIHPGSFVGDTVEEFKKLPPWGKVAVGVVVLAVVYIAYKGYATARSSAPSQSTSLQPTTNASGSQSPFPQIPSGDTSVPLLPQGVNPLYNSQGGLTGYQQSAPPPSTVGATPNPPATVTGSTPPPFYGILGPGLNYDQAKKALPGVNLISGGQNRVWEVSPEGVQTLVTSGYGPPVTNSGYKKGEGPPTPGATAGGGGMSLSSYTVSAGENLRDTFAKLGLNWHAIHALNGSPPNYNHGDKLRLR